MLGPAAITTALADLGAEVIKVETPQGDYVRQMTWPIVEGVSLMHLHVNRGKRSVVIDLRTDEGVELFLDLVREADVVVEAMRPGGLARRGLSFERMQEVNPRIVQCTISGYGATGPYRDLASHGIAYDAWAGIFTPETDANGHPGIPDHVSIGINAGPLFGALGHPRRGHPRPRDRRGRRSSSSRSPTPPRPSTGTAARPTARTSGRSPRSPATSPTTTCGGSRRSRGCAAGSATRSYASTDGYVLFMASEQHFWKKFTDAVERPELFERGPARSTATTPAATPRCRPSSPRSSPRRSTAEWVEFGIDVDVPIAPVNTPHTVHDDPQFRDRMDWFPADALGADQLPFPVKVAGEEPLVPGKAPEVGEHTDAVLRDVLGYDDAKIAALRDAGAIT